MNKRISKVKAHVEQVLFLDSEFKSVRFDVYASDEEEVSYDVEMQNDDTKSLPKQMPLLSGGTGRYIFTTRGGLSAVKAGLHYFYMFVRSVWKRKMSVCV